MRLKSLFSSSIKARLITICAIPAAFFLVFTFFYLIPSLQEDIYGEKKAQTRQMVEVALSILKNHHSQEENGLLSSEEARLWAKKELRSLRYGPRGQDYFWINDFQPRMLVHPFRPDLEGQVVDGFTDPYGKKIFNTFTEICTREDSGFVEYHWQYYDDVDRIEPKLSYVATFEPWGWIVGTGIYIDDIEALIAEKRNAALLYTILATSLTLFFGSPVPRWSSWVAENRSL